MYKDCVHNPLVISKPMERTKRKNYDIVVGAWKVNHRVYAKRQQWLPSPCPNEMSHASWHGKGVASGLLESWGEVKDGKLC